MIAIVTGASRGIGRGVAHELGLAGYTVYVTGRTRDGQTAADGAAGTVDETARLVSESGGRGIAVPCDATDDGAIARLAAAVEGPVDLLVHAAWGGYESYDAALFAAPPEEQPIWRWDKMFATGVRAQYVTTRALLARLRRGSLVVHVGAGDDGKFLGDVQYDVAKAAVDRLGFAFAERLAPRGIVALTLHPGFTRTERVVAVAGPSPPRTHSARFVGRCVLALARDPDVARRAGKAWKAGVLAAEYALTDLDGTRPEPFII